MKTETTLSTLPNGLPVWKLMRFKVTKEKCQIIKINPEVLDTKVHSESFGKVIKLLSIDIQIKRVTLGVPHTDRFEDISQYDLEVWNESMNPKREVTYKRRNKSIRTVVYGN